MLRIPVCRDVPWNVSTNHQNSIDTLLALLQPLLLQVIPNAIPQTLFDLSNTCRMLECSSSLEEMQQCSQEIQYRICWLEALLQETELHLQMYCDRELVNQGLQDLADTPVVGTVLDFIEDVQELYQPDSKSDSLPASTEQALHLRDRLYNNIAWLRKLLTASQIQLKQLSEILETK